MKPATQLKHLRRLAASIGAPSSALVVEYDELLLEWVGRETRIRARVAAAGKYHFVTDYVFDDQVCSSEATIIPFGVDEARDYVFARLRDAA